MSRLFARWADYVCTTTTRIRIPSWFRKATRAVAAAVTATPTATCVTVIVLNTAAAAAFGCLLVGPLKKIAVLRIISIGWKMNIYNFYPLQYATLTEDNPT